MPLLTWNDVDEDVSEALINGTVWYRVLRNITPFGDKWAVAALLPFPYPDSARFTTPQAAKDAVDASVATLQGVLVFLGVTLTPEE